VNWRRLAVAVGYPLVLAVTTLIFRTRPPEVRDGWLAWTSTNLANLGRHPVAAMVTSGLFAEGELLAWVVLALVGLGAVCWSLGGRRTVLLVTAAHVIGTLISEGILAWRIRAGDEPASARLIVDVGPSYVVVGALVAGAIFGARWWRLAALVGLAVLLPTIFAGLPDLEVPAVGHLCAAIVGGLLGWVLWHRRRLATVAAEE
jgi:hypothetical protein